MGEAAIVRMVRLGIVGLALIIAMASPAFAATETADPPAYPNKKPNRHVRTARRISKTPCF